MRQRRRVHDRGRLDTMDRSHPRARRAMSPATILVFGGHQLARGLEAYVGLVPSERSTGEQVRRGSITKAGNPRARRVLIEGAWTYRYPARLSRPLQVRQESLPQVVRAIAWKAQLRLCARYRRLTAAGKRQTLVTTAIAREMAAFLWAIGHAVEPRSA